MADYCHTCGSNRCENIDITKISIVNARHIIKFGKGDFVKCIEEMIVKDGLFVESTKEHFVNTIIYFTGSTADKIKLMKAFLALPDMPDPLPLYETMFALGTISCADDVDAAAGYIFKCVSLEDLQNVAGMFMESNAFTGTTIDEFKAWFRTAWDNLP